MPSIPDDEQRRKEDNFNFFKRAWGYTKAKFIEEKQHEGLNKFRAEQAWKTFRQSLRDGRVQYPRQHLIDKYLGEIPDSEGFTTWSKEDQEAILKQVEAAERETRLEKARQQQAEFQNKQSTTTMPEPEAGPSSEAQMGAPAAKKKRPAPAEAPADNAAEQGSISAGEADNMGSTGGGLAGAGNNTLFKRFGRYTKPICPDDYSYVDTYKRSFATHTMFPEQSEINGAILTDKLMTYTDQPQQTAMNFPSRNFELQYNPGS